MTKHSSPSSEDGDAPPAEAPHVNSSRFNPAQPPNKLDRRLSRDLQHSFSISRRSSSVNWRPPESRNGAGEKPPSADRTSSSPLGLILSSNGELQTKEVEKAPEARLAERRPQSRSPWAIGLLALVASVVGIGFLFTVLHSSVTRQIDPKGCRMSYMRPSYAKLDDFDTEHTRLASKYSLYLYREQGIDHDTKV
jgi:hypothetical protein